MRFFRATIDARHVRVPGLLQVHDQTFVRRRVARERTRMRETSAAVVALEWLFTAVNAKVLLRKRAKDTDVINGNRVNGLSSVHTALQKFGARSGR